MLPVPLTTHVNDVGTGTSQTRIPENKGTLVTGVIGIVKGDFVARGVKNPDSIVSDPNWSYAHKLTLDHRDCGLPILWSGRWLPVSGFTLRARGGLTDNAIGVPLDQAVRRRALITIRRATVYTSVDRPHGWLDCSADVMSQVFVKVVVAANQLGFDHLTKIQGVESGVLGGFDTLQLEKHILCKGSQDAKG